MPKFKWNEIPRPLVTKCCVSLNWSEVQSEPPGNGGTYCHVCEKIEKDNVRFITDKEYDEKVKTQ